MKTVSLFLFWLGFAAAAAGTEAPFRFSEIKTEAGTPPAFEAGAFLPLDRETFVWVGSENSVIEQEHGWIEAHLLASLRAAGKTAVVRHMGWEGDAVYRQNRMENWGSWHDNLAAVGATTVFAWFGGMEALQARPVAEFIAAYDKLLDELSRKTRRLILVTPPPFEKPDSTWVPDNTPRNEVLREYVKAMGELAARRGCVLVDIFSPLLNKSNGVAPSTRNGVHLTAAGLREIAPSFVKSLGLASPERINPAVKAAIIEKNRIWFDAWRPMNWAFAYGDRTTQPFAQAVADRPPFVEELKKSLPLIDHADATIHALLAGTPPPPDLPRDPPRADPPAISPENQKSHFKIREGFAIDLFADEKSGVVRPVQIRWDERGRLWVVCAPSYPHLQPGERPNDFLLVLEDTDGDGRADKSTRWAEGLKMPMGVEFGPDGVYVCESTQLVHLRDTDGDGRADERTVVLSGFGTGDSHQNINSVRWGADGHLWLTQGYHIWSYVETPRGLVELNRSGIWRFNPRTLKLESFLNESAAGLNCWGVTFDDHGQVFHGSGADFSIWHTTPALIPTLHPLPLGAGLARSKGKSMEPEFLGSSHLPDDLQGVLLKSIYFTSQVGLYRLSEDGAGFKSEDLGDLVSSSGPEFRPLETRVGPDGAIYICDWLNPVIGHYQASYRDPRRDRSHGRIWRVTARNRDLLRRPPLEQMSVPELIEQLHSRERWNRDQAKFLLYRRERSAVVAAVLREISKTPSEPFLFELSGVLAAHEAANSNLVDRLLQSYDFRWRAWGTRLAGVWSDRLPDPLRYARAAVSDPHPRVRMEGVVAASTIPSAAALKAATLVLDAPMDPSIEHALTLAIHHLAPHWRSAFVAGQLDFGARHHALARVLSTASDTNLARPLRTVLNKPGIPVPVRHQLLGVLIKTGGVADIHSALDEAPESPEVFRALVAVARERGGQAYGPVVARLLSGSSSGARIAGCKMAAELRQSFGQGHRIRRMLLDESALPEEKEAAFAATTKLKDEEASSREFFELADDPNPKIRLAAFKAIVQFSAKEAAAKAAQILAGIDLAEAAGAVLPAFLERKDATDLLAEAIEAAPLPPNAAKASLQWLARNGRDDAGLVRALRSAASIQASRLEFSDELVRKLVAEARSFGNATAGFQIVRRPDLSCVGCHRLGGEGPDDPLLGPDLSAIGRAMTPEMIVESVLWPKRQVKEGFLLTEVLMKDGTQRHGFKIAETRSDLKLRGVDGLEISVPKAGIQQRSDVGTLMPDGLIDPLTPSDLRDLLKYLIDLGK
jgi:putative heme-binding domain-containing protein